MFRRHLSMALAALVALASCGGGRAYAQSGRCRPARAEGARAGGLSGREAKPQAGVAEETESGASESAGRGGSNVDVRKLNDGRRAQVVFADNGDHHMTKGDKRAGWILLGLLIFEGWVYGSQP
jgi:hypothetical protein